MEDTKQILQQIYTAVAKLEENIDIPYLMPNEFELLDNIKVLPNQSIHYFNRQQALSLLKKFYLGIMLEYKARN